jgi:tetraacyldisaccharide 4'-kinase
MSLLRWFAAPLSPLYGLVVRSRNKAFDAHPERAAKANVPVISIGNLSTGGTGKTPVTLFLAEALEKRGWTNAVISRGYGGKRDIDVMSVEPDSDPRRSGDEPLLMARRLGPNRVVVGRQRIQAARRALTQRPDSRCLLLDDGFQHRALHRDVDLLLLDGVRRWGKGRMLPLGDLREPMESAKRAHALIVTRGSRVKQREEIESWWKQHGSGGPIFWVDFRIGGLRQWNGTEWIERPGPTQDPCFAFCGLGHPDAFYADLLVAAQPWRGTRSFGDHHAPSLRQWMAMQQEALDCEATRLVCTEKDAVKLTQEHRVLTQLPVFIAEQHLVGGEALLTWVLERLEALPCEA